MPDVELVDTLFIPYKIKALTTPENATPEQMELFIPYKIKALTTDCYTTVDKRRLFIPYKIKALTTRHGD